MSAIVTRSQCPGADMQVSQNFWLSIWSEKTLVWQKESAGDADAALAPSAADIGGAAAFPTHFFMTVYFSLGLTSLVFQASRAVVLVLSTLQASQVRLPDQISSERRTLIRSYRRDGP